MTRKRNAAFQLYLAGAAEHCPYRHMLNMLDCGVPCSGANADAGSHLAGEAS